MSKKFKYPLAISGSREQLEALIPGLKELGYTPHCMGRCEISASNPELVLALAAMVDENTFYEGEYAICKEETGTAATLSHSWPLG